MEGNRKMIRSSRHHASLTSRQVRSVDAFRMLPMRIVRPILMLGIILLFLSSACSSLIKSTTSEQGPTPIPVPSPTPQTAAEVIFNVLPPEGTSKNADLALVLIDEVASLVHNATVVPMKRLADGRWQVRLTPPVGSLLRYQYIRNEPSLAQEVTISGARILYRIAHIPGPIQIDDIIAAWSDVPYQGEIGRITGRIHDANTGEPLSEILVNAVGVTDFTDGEGQFRLDGLPPGLHNLVVLSPDGSHQTVQQGAVVAADSMTPVELGLLPAKAVHITFEVIVPSDTIPGTPVRIAGNVQQLGNRFGELEGGISVANSHLPQLALIDPTHYLTVITLYAGTDLRYKYTLGDGLWNAERGSNGDLLTRQIIVPDYDLVVKDVVSTWHERDAGSLRFHLTAPDDTSPSDQISIQFHLSEWHEPIPMWRLDKNEWYFILHGPIDADQNLRYRYCRNEQCGSADDADTAGLNSIGRQVTVSQIPQDLQDEVSAWQWWDPAQPNITVVAPDITSRSGFEVGVSILPAFRPNWMAHIERGMTEIAYLGANAVIISPTWALGANNPTPVLIYDPALTPFENDLRTMVSSAVDHDLQVTLRPSLRHMNGEIEAWWLEASRDTAWWTVWFEEYRSMILTAARQAQLSGVSKLIIGGPEVTPSLPGGVLLDGSSSGVPMDAETQWRTMIEDVREVFSGKIAFEIEFGQELQPIPAIIDAFDEVHIYWHAPLTSNEASSTSEMRLAVRSLFDERILSNPALTGIPIVLDVEYLSVAISATACAKAPDGSCRPSHQFDQGAVIDPDLKVDMEGQAEVINAVLLEAYARSEVMGFYVHGYNPIVVLHDMSASVNGKPASDVLWYWYPRINNDQ
jgi:hypothetical protein